MARALQSHPKKFSDEKLASMVEPLTVRVERIKGSAKTPIPLPEGENGVAAGTEWSKDDVRGIENWLVTEWSGGGLYEITVTDSSVPVALTMTWQPFWSPNEYRELIPPPLAGSRGPIVQPLQFQQAQQPQQQRPPMSAFPQGLPPGYQQPFAGYAPQYPQPQGFFQPPLPAAPMPGTMQFAAWAQEAKDRERDAELRKLREDAAQRERTALDAQHKAELDRERQANEARFNQQNAAITDLRNMIATLATTLQSGAAKNPEIEALKEQTRLANERAESEKRERETERRDREMRETLREMAAQTQRQIELVTKQSEDRMRAIELASMTNKGPDPMLAVFTEFQRQQIEANKELARNATLQMNQMQAMMMNPREMLALAKESSVGAEQATERVSRMFNGVFELQTKVMENALQMQPGGSGALDVVRDGIGGLKELADRYVGGKAQAERAAIQAQVQVAEAQARAYADAARAANPHITPAPVEAAQLAGPAIPQPQEQRFTTVTNGKPSDYNKLGVVNDKPPKKKSKDTVIDVDAPKPSNVKRHGHTDAEWFGPMIGYVEELREGVAKFLGSLSQDPIRVDKDGKPVGVDPEQAAGVIVQAVQQVMVQRIPILAMSDLLFQDRFAEFMDVLLPDATQPYRDDVTNLVIAAAKAGQEPADDDADDDDDDADDDDDDSDDPDVKDGDAHDNTPKPKGPRIVSGKPAQA